MKVLLTPKEEAYILCYIALYDSCDKRTCWKQIAKIIEKYGVLKNKIVYRGQGKKDSAIKNITPFVSTTPNKRMAELFVERIWSLPEDKQRVGHLFKIHLKNALCLSTRNIQYTFTKEVNDEIRKINKDRLIKKGDRIYTFDEFFPKIKASIEELVFANEAQNGEEILVLTGGTFYSDSSMKTKGFMPIGENDFETWYSFSKYNKTRKH
jgi:hypothetical protein